MFTNMSTNYAKYNNLINKFFLHFFFAKVDKILKKKIDAPPLKILEVGCGEGFVLSRLVKLFPQADLVGIDISSQALLEAKKLCPQVELLEGDVQQLDFADNQFDLVVCLEVLEHLPNPDQALREIVRVSKGEVLISVPWEPWFSLGNLLRGRWLKTKGRHPEHINYWTKKDFNKWLQGVNLPIAVQKFYSFPWLLFLLSKQ